MAGRMSLPGPMPVGLGSMRAELPPLYQLSSTHQSRCHLADEPSRRVAIRATRTGTPT